VQFINDTIMRTVLYTFINLEVYHESLYINNKNSCNRNIEKLLTYNIIYIQVCTDVCMCLNT